MTIESTMGGAMPVTTTTRIQLRNAERLTTGYESGPFCIHKPEGPELGEEGWIVTLRVCGFRVVRVNGPLRLAELTAIRLTESGIPWDTCPPGFDEAVVWGTENNKASWFVRMAAAEWSVKTGDLWEATHDGISLNLHRVV